MNKGLIITLIVLLTVIVLGIVAFLIFALTSKNIRYWAFHTKEYKDIAIEEQYDNIYEKITVDSKAGKIIVKNTDEEKIKVVVYAEKDAAKVEQNDKELKIINNMDGCKRFCFTQTIAKIEIYVPSSYTNELKINNKYGDIRIADFKDATLNLDADAGNIEIGQIKNGNINNNAGNIEIKEVETIKIDEKAGNIQIEKITNKVEIKQNAGNIEIKNVDLKENSNIKCNVGNVEIKKTNSIKLEGKTSLGNFKAKDSNSSSDITLTVENDCGNVEIN